MTQIPIRGGPMDGHVVEFETSIPPAEVEIESRFTVESGSSFTLSEPAGYVTKHRYILRGDFAAESYYEHADWGSSPFDPSAIAEADFE